MHRAAMIESHPVAWCYELKGRVAPTLSVSYTMETEPPEVTDIETEEKWMKQISFENPHDRFPEGRVRNVHPLFAVVQYDSALPMGGTGECPF